MLRGSSRRIFAGMLTLDNAGSQRPISEAALIKGVNGGQIPIGSRVLNSEGQWQQVSLWYLEHSRIDLLTETSEQRFVDKHASGFIDEPALLRLLGLYEEADKISDAVREATQSKIETPEWGAADDLAGMLPDGIEMPQWDPDPTGEVQSEIRSNHKKLQIPWWGAPYEMPVADALTVPKWHDPSTWSVDLPPSQNVEWRRMKIEGGDGPGDSVVELLGQRRAAARRSKPTPPIESAAKRRQRERHERRSKDVPPPPKQPQVLRGRKRRREKRDEAIHHQRGDTERDGSHGRRAREREEQRESRRKRRKNGREERNGVSARAEQGPQPQTQRKGGKAQAAVQGVSTESSWGLAGCLFKFVGLGVIIFGAFLAVDAGLQELATRLPAIAPEVKKRARAPRKKLRTLITRGPSATVLHVVVSVDLSRRADVVAARAIFATLAKPGAFAIPPRVVLLPRVGKTKQSRDLAAALLAAHVVGGLWPALEHLPKRQPWTVKALAAALEKAGRDMPRFQKLRHQPATELRARVFSTMAAALRLGPGVPLMVNGWTLPTPLATKQAAVHDFINGHASAAKGVLDAMGGDPGRAWPALEKGVPAAIRSRFSGWIVAGERIPSQPVVLPKSETAARPSGHLDLPAHAPRLGPPNAPVQVVVFSDFHCRHCRKHARRIRRVAAQHKKSVRVRFLHYPIVKLHPKSWQASRAAYAAHQQGRFWPAHDWLFNRGERRFSIPALVEHLAKLAKGSNPPFDRRKFMRDLVAATEALKTDRMYARRLGIKGTPVTFVNGKRMRGARSIRQLNTAITAAMLRTKTGK